MILDLDIGNSRVKWRARAPCATPMGGVFATSMLLGAQATSPLPQAWPLDLPCPRRICVSSVRSPQENHHIGQKLLAYFAVPAEFAQATASCAGVTSAYWQPGSLGVDRWLALVAARHQFAGDLVVVDGGTALTVDVLSSGGIHLGGYILPGVNNMINGLRQNTAAVRVDMAQMDVTLQPGRDTSHCVAAGVSAAARGVLSAAIAQLPQPARVVVCGGDNAWLTRVARDLPCHIHTVPDLVLDGLALALPDHTDYFE